MSGRIPQAFLDELLARTDIVEVIDARVPLKKAGKDYQACCPFHSEKTPSFTVSPAKQFYHCFGCGAHGNAISFLMEYDRLPFPDAVEELARLAGMEVPREAGRQSNDDGIEPLYRVHELAAEAYRETLRKSPAAIEYLRGRGLSGEIARDFGIGHAPPGWSFLIDRLGRDPVLRTALVQAGLVVEKPGGRLHDRFRDRIMFPIRDRRGRVVAFGGRVLGEGTPKYLNSPETPIFHKGRLLYGLYEARQAHRRLERVIVVEGYMDVVALAQHGIRNAVATLGTSTTTEQVEQLFRVTDEIVFCFDGDAAGRAAAWRAAENALPAMRAPKQARFLFLPEGEDPDSRVRTVGREGFLEDLADAIPFSEFFFRHLREDADLDTAEGRARLAARARPLLDRLPEGPFRELMEAELAELTRLQPRPGRRRAQTIRQTPQPTHTTPVREAIRLLLHHPFLARDLSHPPPRDERLPGLPLLAELVDFIAESPHLPTTGAILEHFREHPAGQALWKLAERPPKVPEGGELTEFLGFLDLIERELEARHLQDRLAALSARPPSALTPEETEELRRLLACQVNIRER